MNPTEISLKSKGRLNRIEIASGIAKWIMYVFVLFAVWLSLKTIIYSSSPLTYRTSLGIVSGVVLCIWYWKLAQLFRGYERGLIFAADTIRCIKILGLICLAGAVLKSAAHFSPKPPPLPQPGVTQTVLPSGVTIISVIGESHVYQFGFFSFDFGTGMDFGLMMSGVVIVLIAWIMDEGRKMRDEQELTV